MCQYDFFIVWVRKHPGTDTAPDPVRYGKYRSVKAFAKPLRQPHYARRHRGQWHVRLPVRCWCRHRRGEF